MVAEIPDADVHTRPGSAKHTHTCMQTQTGTGQRTMSDWDTISLISADELLEVPPIGVYK